MSPLGRAAWRMPDVVIKVPQACLLVQPVNRWRVLCLQEGVSVQYPGLKSHPHHERL